MELNSIQKKARNANLVNIDRSFLNVDSTFGGKLSELINAVIEQSPEEVRVLDIGCGNGRALSDCVEMLSGSVTTVVGTGVDLNPIEDASVNRDLIELVEADAQDLSALDENSYDIGFSMATAQYIEDPLKAFFEVNRVMRPGGVFLWKFATSPARSTIIPIFREIKEKSPNLQPFFSTEPGIVINHPPVGIEMKPSTHYTKLRSAKGLGMSEEAHYNSEYWLTEYGKKSLFQRFTDEYGLMPKSHKDFFDRVQLKSASYDLVGQAWSESGMEIPSIPLAPLLNLSTPSTKPE